MKTGHKRTPFARLVSTILTEIKERSCTGRPKIKDKYKLSTDIALVGSCIRTAYLVDAFAPSDPVSYWQELLQKLRSNTLTSSAFASVVHIFDPGSEQSFIVNVSMIPKLLCGVTVAKDENLELNRNDYPVLVQISPHQTFQLLDAFPLPLLHILSPLDQTLPNHGGLPSITHILPHLISSLSVPLAGILLDYSVAYVPESGSTSGSKTATSNSFSSNLMHFFECILNFSDLGGSNEAQFKSNYSSTRSQMAGNQQIDRSNVKSCTIMKFSCPASECSSLQPEKIISHLNDLFTERLKSTGDSTLFNIEIHQTTGTLDRLVF